MFPRRFYADDYFAPRYFSESDGQTPAAPAAVAVHPDYYWARRTRHYRAYKSKAGPFVILLTALSEVWRA